MANSDDPKIVEQNLMEHAEKRFGAERAKELKAEIHLMAEQLATLRSTPVDLQDEP
jgi:hypothetical protein